MGKVAGVSPVFLPWFCSPSAPLQCPSSMMVLADPIVPQCLSHLVPESSQEDHDNDDGREDQRAQAPKFRMATYNTGQMGHMVGGPHCATSKMKVSWKVEFRLRVHRGWQSSFPHSRASQGSSKSPNSVRKKPPLSLNLSKEPRARCCPLPPVPQHKPRSVSSPYLESPGT